jgi:hypothetical protein
MASESTQLGTWEFNPLTNQLIWSEQCLKIYGLPPENIPEYDEVTKHRCRTARLSLRLNRLAAFKRG